MDNVFYTYRQLRSNWLGYNFTGTELRSWKDDQLVATAVSCDLDPAAGIVFRRAS